MDIVNKNRVFSNPLSILIYIGLPLLCLFFLWLHKITHNEFLLHLAAIPLEILIGAFLVERFIANQDKKQQLRKHMFIKSIIFRSELRKVYIANLNAMKKPSISIAKIRSASTEQLKGFRDSLNGLQYGSDKEIENVIMEYVHAEKTFYRFMWWAVEHDFEAIFISMIHLLHFIRDVRQFKEYNPDKLFVTQFREDPKQMQRINTVMKEGILSFLNYVIQLKEENQDLVEEILEEYENFFNQYGSPVSDSTPG